MKYIRSLTAALALSMAITSVSLLSIVFDAPFFDKQFTKLGSYDRQPTALQEARKLMQYRVNNTAYIDTPVYTQDEVRHLYDVKQLIQKTGFMAAGSLIIVILIALTTRYVSPSPNFWKRTITRGVLIFVVVVGSLIVLSMLDFDQMFEQFHHLFFVDNRQFPGNSSFLIQSYPLDFFYNAAVQRVFRAVTLRLLLCLPTFYLQKLLLRTSTISVERPVER